MERIGFMGLGNIGRGICKNIIKGGYDVTVFDPVPAAMERFKDTASLAGDAKEIIQNSDVVFFSLPDSKTVESIMNVFFEVGVEGKTIVDASTSYPLSTKKLYSETKKRGGAFVDAPLLDGPAEAEAGQLEILVGGDKEDYDRLMPIFKTYTRRVRYIGETGSGHLAKLAINYVGGIYSFGLAQAFPVFEKLGIKGKELYDIFDCDALNNGVFRFYGKKYAEHNHQCDFALRLCMKDFRYVKQLHDDLGVDGFILDGMMDLGNRGLAMEKQGETLDTSYVEEVMVELLGDK